MTQTLDEIALSLDPIPDKSSRSHGYTLVYEPYLAPLRDRPIRLLEIGVWEGASLQMWSRAFPQGLIVGVDLDLSRVKKPLPPNVATLQGSQDDRAFLAHVALHGPFDVILDDGSHLPEHQRASFDALWPHVTPGGLYIVEDLQVGYTLEEHSMLRFLGLTLQSAVHGHGRSLHASPTPREVSQLSAMEREIDSIHLHRYTAIVKKRARPFGGAA